jgi:hypothetical protein
MEGREVGLVMVTAGFTIGVTVEMDKAYEELHERGKKGVLITFKDHE